MGMKIGPGMPEEFEKDTSSAAGDEVKFGSRPGDE
jgi:hypothetical protein